MTAERTCVEWKNFICPSCGSCAYNNCEKWDDGFTVGFCDDCGEDVIEHPDGRISINCAEDEYDVE